MPAAYDTYDYPSYWHGRDYEHGSEIIAIRSLLEKIPKIKKILEIGSGYGRLTPSYRFRAERIVLVDPSSKLLKIAKINLNVKDIKFVHSSIENLSKKMRARSVDLIIFVRVLHHLKNPDNALKTINKLLKDKGFVVLEFANKCHFKAKVAELIHGNITFPLEIFPRDLRSKRTKKKGSLPFLNFHPEAMKNKLEEAGFKIIEERSVSNFRNSLVKKILSTAFLLSLEKYLQKPFSYIDFGPSVFILAQKKDRLPKV